MVDEARTVVTTIRQMEASLDDSRPRSYQDEDDDLQITYPLNQCLQTLKEKHLHISRLHRERFEQVESRLPSTPSRPPPGTNADATQNLSRLSNRTRRI